jgi:hypothetical protein
VGDRRRPRRSGEQDLAGPALLGFAGPLNGIEPARFASAMRVDLPAVIRLALRVDGDDDALRPEPPRPFGDQLGALHRGGLDRDLVRAGAQQGADLVDLANAATDGEWDKNLARGPFDHVDQRGALLGRRLDVEEDQLVRTLFGIGTGHRDRVALVTKLAEMHALDHAATGDVKTGNDPLEQHALPLPERT